MLDPIGSRFLVVETVGKHIPVHSGVRNFTLMKRFGILAAVIAAAFVAFLAWRPNEHAQIRSEFQINRKGYEVVAQWVINHGRTPGWVDLPKDQQELCGHSSALLLGTEGNYCVLFAVRDDSDGVAYITFTEKEAVEMESVHDDIFTVELLEPHWQISGAV